MTDESKTTVDEQHAKDQRKEFKDQMARANAVLVPFTPTTDFVGYPFGKDEAPMTFMAGMPAPAPVPKAWLDSISADKGGNKPASKPAETKPATQG